MAVVKFDEETNRSDDLDDFRRKFRFKSVKFCIYLSSIQLAILCFFIRFVRYAVRADASLAENGISVALGGGAGRTEAGNILRNIILQILLFAVFLRVKSKLHMILISLAFQWSLLCRGFCNMLMFFLQDEEMQIRLDVHALIEALLAVFALQISLAFIWRKIAPLNFLMTIMMHAPVYNALKFLLEEILQISDSGSGLSVHLFGALYGWALHLTALKRNNFAFNGQIGVKRRFEYSTVVIIIFIAFPVLNGVMSESDGDMTRCVVNSLVASVSSVIVSFAVNTVHNQLSADKKRNSDLSVLSGGIAVSSCAVLMLQPFGAMVIGFFAGLLSTLSYLFLEPYLEDKLKVEPNSEGILSFHGVSALIGALSSIILAASSEEKNGLIEYQQSLYPIYPARIPIETSSKLGEILSNYPFLEAKAASRTASDQALFQALAVLLTVATALLTGAVNGLCIRLSSEMCGNQYPIRRRQPEMGEEEERCETSL